MTLNVVLAQWLMQPFFRLYWALKKIAKDFCHFRVQIKKNMKLYMVLWAQGGLHGYNVGGKLCAVCVCVCLKEDWRELKK